MSDRPAHRMPDTLPEAPWPRLLAGEGIEKLPLLDTTEMPDMPADLGRDDWLAVTTGLRTPDFCLIGGAGAARRGRIAAEIAIRAAGTGERVMLLQTQDHNPGRGNCARGQCCPVCAGVRLAAKTKPLRWWSPRLWIARLLRRSAAARSDMPPNMHMARLGEVPNTEFGLLIIQDADRVNESALAEAIQRSRRTVLLGDPTTSSSHGPGSFFLRIWEQFWFEPWINEGGRIVCRLQKVPADRRGELEVEPVADRPEIELRILTTSSLDAQLAEVAFPPTMGIAEAKAYLLDELGEAPFSGVASGRWSESTDAIAINFQKSLDSAPTLVPLGEGVCELIGTTGQGWTTNAIRFSRAAGWNRESASKWIEQHSRRCDFGRAVMLH